MKKLFVFVALAALLASCVQSETLDVVDQVQKKDRKPIKFDIYTPRNVATKAGTPGEITTASLSVDGQQAAGKHSADGFGVFAYYTDNGKYDQYCKPNYMYNQQVKYIGGEWKYEPVKYWPNETGNAAISDDKDHVSFFAYAPYVKVTPSTGALDITVLGDNPTAKQIDSLQNYNITGMTNNAATGDPLIKYVVDWAPATSVDLLWGVDERTNLPMIDTIKQTTTETLKFKLYHALAKVNFQIDAFVDATTNTKEKDKCTKIWVRSITFHGFATKGALNLNSKDSTNNQPHPLWMDYAGSDELSAASFTIYDGRKDGKEGYDFTDGSATNEKVLGLNPEIIQPGKYQPQDDSTLVVASNPTIAGVTKKAVNLFNPTGVLIPAQDTPSDEEAAKMAVAPIYVIPTNETLAVTIIYDVETYDPNLSGYLSDGVTHGSSIENKINKTITLGTTGNNLTLEAGKAYTIKLHLGMTTVKTEAEVNRWTLADESNVDLPANTTNN